MSAEVGVRTQSTRAWYRQVLDRWPTLVAVLLTFDGVGGNFASLAQALPYLPLLYVIVAKIERRRSTWPVLFLLLAIVTLCRLTGWVEPFTVAVGIALVVLVWAAIDGDLRDARTFHIQTLGLLLFGMTAAVALVVAPGVALYLVAAGWFFHGVWDFVHWYRDAVVARSFAEFCGVIDVLIAVSLVVGY